LSLLFLPSFDLSQYNSLAVPARAAFYVSVSSVDQLREALAFARSEGLPRLILGGGSNLVLTGDFPGLVIHLRLQGKEQLAEDEQHVWLKVAAGESWSALVEYTLDNHCWGLENLSLIPGTVGAAPIQNIGAYGVELCDLFEELEALEIASGVQVIFDRDACAFGYRESIFKGPYLDKYVITSVTFKLRKEPRLVLDYPALAEALTEVPADALTPRRVADTVIALRRSKLPDPAQIPNVGSFFKNPYISIADYTHLQSRWPDIPGYPEADRVKLPAAWLIDKAGWRGYGEGGVGVHAQQALVLVNPGRGPGAAVMALASRIQASVLERFGIKLELEPRTY
jgi:UDP-N-acetylmuramate dehydrogenase